MRMILQTAYNRAIVLVSSCVMFFCAIVAGASRQFFERISPEFMTQIIPNPPWESASLGVIALLFLTGMAANVVLVMYPLERRRAVVSLVVMGAALLTLLLISFVYGSQVLRVLMWSSHGVSPGGGDS